MKLFLSSAPQFLCAELTLEDSLVFSSSQRGMPVLNNSQDFRIHRVRIQQGTGTGSRQCKKVCAIQEQNSNITSFRSGVSHRAVSSRLSPFCCQQDQAPIFVLDNLESKPLIQELPNAFWSCQIFSVC